MDVSTRSTHLLALLIACFTVYDADRAEAADTVGGAANWFATVAEAERLAEAEADKQQPPPAPPSAAGPASSPGGSEQPPPPTVDLDALRALIGNRNRIVNDRLFDAVKSFAAGGRPNQRQIEALRDWFAVYFQMRAFVPTSRQDPTAGSVIDILEDAVRHRRDFVEGRILAVPCLLYAGRVNDARTHLEEASAFLTQRGLNPTPFGLDCCGGWLRLGEPDAVKSFIGVLKNPAIVPAHKLTAVQAALVAVHSWQTFRFNDAKDYFEKSLRRADAFDKAPAAGVQGLLADAALFYLVAGNPTTRNAERGGMLLGRIPADNQTWYVRRARAALHASQAAAADGDAAAGLWESAVQELEVCRQDSLPTLDAEIDQQLAKYRLRELWFRERPKAAGKPAGDAAHRRFSRQVAAGAPR